MDAARKKALLESYRNRQPEMGIIALTCLPTKEVFLEKSVDNAVAFNGIFARLKMDYHPNQHLQALWNQYGAEHFTTSVVKILKYEDKNSEHQKELEALMMTCLTEIPNSQRMWR